MTVSDFRGSTCRQVRLLLGVYVLGAIDPAERAVVDEHLIGCPSCRDELAGLAGLPAMLSRVPPADVARLMGQSAELPMAEPPAEMLDSLLRKVAVRRRRRGWRTALAAAAAVLVAAGGAAAGSQLAASHSSHPAQQVATGSGAGGTVVAQVDYSPTAWGTAMRIHVTGISPGTTCKFWVVQKDGKVSLADTWTITSGYYAPRTWYQAASPVSPNAVRSFQITAANSNKVLVTIPAT